MVKERFDIRISPDLRRQLDAQAVHDGGITALAERYFREGLARDSGELIEQSSLPAVREAVRSEFNVCLGELYEKLSRDLQQSARKSDDRLAALIVKAARSAGIAQRMLFSLASKLVSNDFAMKIWESAKEQTGKALVKPEEKTEA
jgi:CRP-like cAMP-binding protein